MSEPSASGRTGRIAARAGLGTLAAIVIAAATVGVIDLAGGGFAGASAAWQHVVALGAVAALGAVLTLGRPAPSHPLAGHPDARPARWRWPAEALAIAAAVATWLLWLGPQPLGSDPQPAEPFAVLLQTDRLADAPADEPAQRFFIDSRSAKGDLPSAGQEFEAGAATTEGDIVRRPFSLPKDHPWLIARANCGASEWPVALPPGRLVLANNWPVGRDIPPTLAARSRSPARDGEPALSLGLAIPKAAPAAAFPIEVERRVLHTAGAKGMLSDLFAGPSGERAYYWIGFPQETAQRALADDAAGGGYDLVVDTLVRESPEGDKRPNDLAAMYPLWCSGSARGAPTFFLATVGGEAHHRAGEVHHRAGFDPLGESGQRQVPALFDYSLRLWRSRRHAAAGALVVPEEAGQRRPTTARTLLADRHLPPVIHEPDRLSAQSFPRPIWLLAATALLWAGAAVGLVRRN